MPDEPWMVSFSDKAKDDLDNVLRQTLTDYGARQLQRYSGLIKNAIGEGIYSFPRSQKRAELTSSSLSLV